MAVWMVRAGAHGEREELALEQGLAVIGWGELPDLARVRSREELGDLYRSKFPDARRGLVANHVGQLWAFRDSIQVGDLVVLPLKTRSAIAIGTVKGGYEYRVSNPEDARHVREVQWARTDIPRASFGQDLLYSLGAFMTVCRIQRNQAEQRIRAVLGGSADPGAGPEPVEEPEVGEAPPNLEEYAGDQIRSEIGRRFRGHELARLVGALLQAQGYQTRISPPGPDGGVDIIAGHGPMGFDPPRLCVQVKSSDQPVDVRVLRELQGTMKNFGAEQGLLVAWGGFKPTVLAEARQRFFEVRLWDAGELVQVLVDQYDQLSKDIQAELPLKRIWILVPEE
jgi:restriction system protein